MRAQKINCLTHEEGRGSVSARAHKTSTHSHRGGSVSACAHESAQNVSSRTKRGGEVSVLLCIGVSHFFTTIYERVHECLTINKHNKAYADSLGEVCSALKPRPLIKRETVSKHTKGCFSGENNLL